jgi:hypothetical protein
MALCEIWTPTSSVVYHLLDIGNWRQQQSGMQPKDFAAEILEDAQPPEVVCEKIQGV